MVNETLEQLYSEHNGKVSDKWSIYIAEYERIFSEYRDKSINLLEIGVQNGGSLEIWSKFFVNAKKIVGCDINPECARLVFSDHRIAVVVGDANLSPAHSLVLQQAPVFDVVIDDGSHRSSDIVKSFARYFPCLADGGVFVAEDLHCSYWGGFEGGLFDPFSSITFFKRLADIVNYEHWGSEKKRSDILRGFFLKFDFKIDEDVLAHIHSIEFINSICVVRKAAPRSNLLGFRVISGLDEAIVPGGLSVKSSISSTPNQIDNLWTSRTNPPEEDVLHLEGMLSRCDENNEKYEEQNKLLSVLKEDVLRLEEEIKLLKTELVRREDEMVLMVASKNVIEKSLSWRITRPLRYFSRQVRNR